MNRPRRGTKSERASISNSAQDVALQLRPEKTRVALLTFENILIVSLDCKLLLNIPLWREAAFSVEGYGKDLVLIAQMDMESKPESGSSIIAETQNLFAAPWDATSSSRRRKPNPGELVRDIISCGSVSAREDLCHAILKLLEAKQKNSLRNYAWGPALRRSPSAIELPVLQGPADDGVSRELSRTRRTEASDGSAGVFVMPMRSPVEPEEPRSTLTQEETGELQKVEEKNKTYLDNSVRRLSMSGTKRAIDAKRSIRIIVTNEVETGLPLSLVKSSLDRGYWRLAAPSKIEPFEAAMFEVDSGSVEEMKRLRQKGGREVYGYVLYRLTGPSNMPTSTCPQVQLDFVNPYSGSPKYSTRTTGGLLASYERGQGNHATVHFKVHGKGRSTSTAPQWGESAAISSSSASSSSSSRRNLMKRAGGKLLGLASGRSQSSSSASQQIKEDTDIIVDDTAVAKIVELGFPPDAAVDALRTTNGDLLEAINILTSK